MTRPLALLDELIEIARNGQRFCDLRVKRHLPTVEAAHQRIRRLQEMFQEHDRAGA